MKVLIVTPYFHPSTGGVQNYVLNIARGLRKDYGHQIIIATSGDQHGKIKKQKFEGMTVYRLPYTCKIYNTPVCTKWRQQIEAIIADEKPDLINAHTPVPYMAEVAARAAGKLPFILTYHNDLAKPTFTGTLLARIYYLLFSRRSMKRSDRIIATSEYYISISPYLQKHKDKISIVPPGVDLELFNPEVDKTWLKKKYPGKKIVLFVGSMEKNHAHKGIDVLLNAAAQAKKSVPNLQLVVAGKGDAIPMYKQLAEDMRLADTVDFPGFVPDTDLPKYFAGADAFVLPSTSEAEGFGMVLAEAQACGTPVIGTKVGGIPHALQANKTGSLIQPNSVSALKNAILKILEGQNDFGKDGSRFVRTNFNWQKLIADYNNCLERYSRPLIVQAVSYYPPHQGGMEVAVQQISVKLSKSNFRVRVLTSDIGSHAHDETVNDDLQVKYLSSKEIARTPIIWSLWRNIMALPRNCVVTISVAVAFVPEVTALACKIRGIPYVARISLETPPSSGFGKIILPLYKKIILKPVLAGATKVIVSTDDYAEIMQTKYDISQDDIVLIPNATDFTIAKKERTSPSKHIRLLFVGRLVLQKNLDLLIHSLALYRKNHGENIRLTIIGEGELRPHLSRLIKAKGLRNIVSLKGSVYGQQLQREYEHSDIFVLPSTREASPLVLPEAMAKGLPIIATDILGVRNIVKHQRNGLLIQDDPQQLCDTIRQLATRPHLYQKLSRNNLRDVAANSWESFIEKLGGLYNEAQEP